MLKLGGLLSPCLLFSALVLVACGEVPHNHKAVPLPAEHIEPELQTYLESYLEDAARAGVPVQAEMLRELRRVEWTEEKIVEEGDELSLGHCSRINSNSVQREERFRTIRIAPLHSLGLNLATRKGQIMMKAILYHELGHCLHDFYGHRPIEDQVIMSSELPEKRFGELPELISEHFRMMH